MANEDAGKPKRQSERRGVQLGPATPIERYALIALGFVLVGALLLIVFTERTLNPLAFPIVRVLLALTAAAVGALLPGFLELDGKTAGWQLRAGGAVALFIIVFFALGQPQEGRAQAIQMRTLSTLDIRAGREDNPEQAPVAVVLGIGFDSREQVSVQDLNATLVAGEAVTLLPYHYTELTTAPSGGWLPSTDSFRLGPFDNSNREIAFYPESGNLFWGEFARGLLANPPGLIRVTINARLNDDTQFTSMTCSVDFSGAAQRARQQLDQTGRPPSRLSIQSQPQCA